MGLQTNPRLAGNRKYKLNEEFFDKIDSPRKAQLLGLIYSDGTLGNNTIAINLQIDDKNYLESMKSYINTDKPLYFLDSKERKFPSGRTFRCKPVACFSIYSTKLYNACIKLGLCRNKTYNRALDIPNRMPKKLLKYFILGLFEGDGWISRTQKTETQSGSTTWGFCGGKRLCISVKNIIHKELGIDLPMAKMNGIWYVRIARKLAVKKILEWLYDGKCKYMQRKLDKAVEFMILNNFESPIFRVMERNKALEKLIILMEHKTQKVPTEQESLGDGILLN